MNSISLRPKLLHRKRISDIMSQILETPLFFVSASMGYGKTLAVKEFLDKNKELNVSWHLLPDEENDPHWLWKKTTEALSYLDEELSKKAAGYGYPKCISDIEKIIELIRDTVDDTAVFVVDDWQNVNVGSDIFSTFMKKLCLAAIPKLHIVIISRKGFPDEFVELEYKEKCIVVRQPELEFTSDDTAEFFRINGFKLSEDEKKHIYTYTGGWTLATYLSLLQYYNTNKIRSALKAEEIMKIMVFNKFQENSQKVLLALTPLNNFTIEQACEISGTKKAADIIKIMKKHNCFIKYDYNTNSYMFHSILKKVLRQELLNSNVDSEEIYNNCGKWYEKNGNIIEAIKCYYGHKKYDEILKIIEKNDLVEFMYNAPKITFKIFNEIDVDKRLKYPIAYLKCIFIYILQIDKNKGLILLKEVKKCFEENNILDRYIEAEILLIQTICEKKQVDITYSKIKKAYELFNGETSKIIGPGMPFTFGAASILGMLNIENGMCERIVKDISEATYYFTKITNGCGEGAEYLIFAEYNYVIGNLNKAEILSKQALQCARMKNQISIIISALMNLVKIEIANGMQKSFEKHLKELQVIHSKSLSTVVFSQVESVLICLYSMLDMKEKFPKWLYEQNVQKDNIFIVSIEDQYVILAASLLCRKKFIELEIYTMQIIKILDNDVVINKLYMYIFNIIATYNIYGIDKADKRIIEAVNISKDNNLIMPWVEVAPFMIEILQKSCMANDSFIKNILIRSRKYIETYKNYDFDDTRDIEVSDREFEIIKFVENGYTQKQIANQLNIAVVTVKKHLTSLYFKLNVKNKVQAINKLKRAGIL